jgi:hypothetical protein
MIAKGSQRGGSRQLAKHLMNDRDNDHVELHEIRGLDSTTLAGAFLEIEAASKATRCKQPFFHVSFSPPAEAAVSYGQFEQAFAAVEAKYPELAGQPRAIVFHEKDGRRHAHAVWSRIDTERSRAINLSHFKLKLRDVSRTMYQALGLPLPKGLIERNQRSPLNFDRQEWQQAKRLDEDPRDLKKIVREAFTRSDSAQALQHALAQSALYLARGDRRGYVLIHHSGEVISLSRVSGFKAKELAARIGDPALLPAAADVQARLAALDTARGQERIAEARARLRAQLRPLQEKALLLRQRHRMARAALLTRQETRWQAEELVRANRLRSGLMGMWDRLTGRRGRVSQTNAREAAEARERDRGERDGLIAGQLLERRALRRDLLAVRRGQQIQMRQLRSELGAQFMTASSSPAPERGPPSERPPPGDAGRGEGRGSRGPSPGGARGLER